MMTEPAQEQMDALRDVVTGLPSVESVRQRMQEWLAVPQPGGDGARVHALLLGLRRFDAVNLAYGTATGDAALAEAAGRISHFAADELDGPWLLARNSGDSFLLVADEACSRERWQLFAAQLEERIARPIISPAGTVRLSPRLAMLRGLVGENADSMIDRLGHALESLKRQQGRRLAWADGKIVRHGLTATQLEADFLRAVDRKEIEIVFQPQFSLEDDRLSGAEALARWNHPELGRIGAGALFSIAERADQLAPLSRHIARLALHAAQDWPAHLRLSLNVTPADLAAESYTGKLTRILQESGFPPDRLTLEVTEQALLHDIQLAARILRALSGSGIRVALDDFGAGFCNFHYLKLLPLDYLKLDRSMIEGITCDPRDLAILRGIVAMAGALDLKTVVEGVETEEQRAIVAQEGCLFYQGFLRAQPMSVEAFAQVARDSRPGRKAYS